MSDLPRDMEEEVLSRIPVTSLGELRSICKKWNTLTKGESFLKRHAAKGAAKKKQRKVLEVVMMLEYRVSLMSVDLHHPSIERIGNLDADGVNISKIFHCDGLFLCCIAQAKGKGKGKDSSRLVVWNPYLGQTRWIEPRNSYHIHDRYALGYEHEKKKHKVLRFVDSYDSRLKYRTCEFEMYSLNSDSWKVIDDFTPDWRTSITHQRGLSLKGNTYWYAQEKIPLDGPQWVRDLPDFLLSFDFTREIFGPRLPLPFHAFCGDTVTLSSVREEQLAVLFQERDAPAYPIKIWITTKIEPNAVSWSNLFLALDMKRIQFFPFAGSFFVDEEKKVAVVLDKDRRKSLEPPTRNIAYIIGNNGYLKHVDLGESRDQHCHPLVCESRDQHCHPLVCSYVPSSVQIEQPRQPEHSLIC